MAPVGAVASDPDVQGGNLVIWATNSVKLSRGSSVISNGMLSDVVAQNPFVGGDQSVRMERNASTDANTRIVGDDMKVDNGAVAGGDAYYNTLSSNGTINGGQFTPLVVPVPIADAPGFRTGTPGSTDVSVGRNGTSTIAPGAYRDIVVDRNGTLVFNGAGDYSVRSITLGRGASVELNADDDVEILVKQRFSASPNVSFGPASGASIAPDNVAVYVEGATDTTEASGRIGHSNTFEGTMFVRMSGPELTVGKGTTVTGALFGTRVKVDENSSVTAASFFGGADLSITKTDSVDPAISGEQLSYTVTVTNSGPQEATNVVVTDTLPAAVSAAATSGCTEDPAGVPTCSLGNIASGGSAQYTITVDVDAGLHDVTITNSASVTSDRFDPDPSNNAVAEDTLVLEPTADLSISKTDDVDPVVAGDTIVYTVTVNNAGPQTATDVVVVDTLPAGVTLVQTAGCSEDPNGVPICSLGSIASGGSAQYTIAVEVDPGVVGTLVNNASVTSSITDPNTSNNSTSEETVALPTADLSITKSDSVDPILAGDAQSYLITVTNAGPQTAENVVVTDTLPAGVTFVSTTGCTNDPNGAASCSLGDIPSGGSAQYEIAVSVDPATVGTITNSASVASDTADPNGANNSTSEDTLVIERMADLSITKTDSIDPVLQGDSLMYTITVSNSGPQTAENVVVTDTLPAGVTFVSTTGCTEDGNGVPTCSLGDIAASGSAQYTVSVDVDITTVGTITNNASVASDTADPDSANNSTNEDTLVIAPMADLSITKTDSADPVLQGDPLTYTITVFNAGAQTAENVVVTDTLPAGVTFVSTLGCTEDGNGVPTCSLGDIAPGGQQVYMVTVDVDSTTLGTITNSASVTSDTADPDSANNSTSAGTLVIAPSADLSITKIDAVDPIIEEGIIAYTVTVSNAGPNSAVNVVATDTLPAGVTLVSTSGCSSEDPNGVPTCSLGDIAAGGSAHYTIEVTADPGTLGTITNTVSVASDTADPDGANNSASEDTTVNPPIPEADLSITKTDDVDPIVAGNTLTYTVTVSNAGPQAAANVVVTDTLPAGVTLVSTDGCAEDPAGVPTCSLGSIASGASADYTIEVTVGAGTSGTISNSASVTSDTVDPDGGNNSATESTTVIELVDAVDDSYDSAGNVGITVSAGAGVLANDTGSSPTVTASDVASANGGAVAVAADGSFTYDPPAGFTGADTFGYTATDVTGSDSATVTVTVGDMYWFIDNTAGAGTGTLQSPFNTLAAFEAVNGNGGLNPGAGDVIFVYSGVGSYTGGLTLENNQVLVGQGATASITSIAGTSLPTHSNALPSTGGTRPTLVDGGAGDNAVDLGSGNTIRGLNVGNTGGGDGIAGNSVGTLTVLDLAVTSTGGPALDLDTGVMNLTIDAVVVPSSSVGGIDLTNVGAGSTINLSGIDVTTSGSTGINVTGVGTLNVTGAGNDVSTTGGAAVIVSGTQFGGSGVTFESVSSSNTSTNGISLTNTGAGAFTVTGLGTTDGTGGTLSNITSDGVRLANTDGLVTLNNMNFTTIGNMGGANTRSGHDAIHGENVDGGLSIDNATADDISDNFINGAAHSNGLSATRFVGLSVTNSNISDTNRYHLGLATNDTSDEGGVRIVGLSGNVTITGNIFERSAEMLDIFTSTTATMTMTVTGNTFQHQDITGSAPTGKACADVTIQGSASHTVTVGTVASGNTFLNCPTASLRIIPDTGSTGTVNASVVNNDFRVTDHSDNNVNDGSANWPQGGVALRTLGTGQYNLRVQSNNFGAPAVNGNATDYLMNADGATAALLVRSELGPLDAEVLNNNFYAPVNGAWIAEADGPGANADIRFENNFYEDAIINLASEFFVTFTGPGLSYDVLAENGGTLDFTIANEALAQHEVDPAEAIDIEDSLQFQARGGGTLCGSLTNVTTELTGTHGEIRFLNVSNANTVNRHDGGGNDPFQDDGTIGSVGGCTAPTIPF